jgi:hypothetical protein
VIFASDLDRLWNDFPLHPAFVPFVVEAVRHVADVADRTRDYTVGAVPTGVPPRPGIQKTAAAETISVNVDPRESATATMSPQEFEAMLDRISHTPKAAEGMRAQQAEARQSYWQYGLLLMLGTLIVESFVGRP